MILKRTIISFTLLASLSAALVPLYVGAQDQPRVFAPEPLAQEQSQGRNIASCLSGWRQFLAAGIGYESFKDYWRDFFLWPMHYADVASIEQQMNKARYAVMATFIRCDLTKLSTVTESYYKLEAELYFVRHFIDTSGGFAKILTENPGEREKFLKDMMDYMILRKKSDKPEEDRAKFSGYFDLFDKKYKKRAQQYKSIGSDPVYEELGAKFDQLIETFKGFTAVNDSADSEGGVKKDEKTDAKKQPDKKPDSSQAPDGVIKDRADEEANKFLDACVTTPNDRYCLLSTGRPADPFAASGQQNFSQRRTFQEVVTAVQKQQEIQVENIKLAEMLTRYEVLYGDVSGAGVVTVLNRMDTTNAILTKGKPANKESADPKISGSFAPLERLQKCANIIVARQCK